MPGPGQRSTPPQLRTRQGRRPRGTISGPRTTDSVPFPSSPPASAETEPKPSRSYPQRATQAVDRDRRAHVPYASRRVASSRSHAPQLLTCCSTAASFPGSSWLSRYARNVPFSVCFIAPPSQSVTAVSCDGAADGVHRAQKTPPLPAPTCYPPSALPTAWPGRSPGRSGRCGAIAVVVLSQLSASPALRAPRQ